MILPSAELLAVRTAFLHAYASLFRGFAQHIVFRVVVWRGRDGSALDRDGRPVVVTGRADLEPPQAAPPVAGARPALSAELDTAAFLASRKSTARPAVKRILATQAWDSFLQLTVPPEMRPPLDIRMRLHILIARHGHELPVYRPPDPQSWEQSQPTEVRLFAELGEAAATGRRRGIFSARKAVVPRLVASTNDAITRHVLLPTLPQLIANATARGPARPAHSRGGSAGRARRRKSVQRRWSSRSADSATGSSAGRASPYRGLAQTGSRSRSRVRRGESVASQVGGDTPVQAEPVRSIGIGGAEEGEVEAEAGVKRLSRQGAGMRPRGAMSGTAGGYWYSYTDLGRARRAEAAEGEPSHAASATALVRRSRLESTDAVQLGPSASVSTSDLHEATGFDGVVHASGSGVEGETPADQPRERSPAGRRGQQIVQQAGNSAQAWESILPDQPRAVWTVSEVAEAMMQRELL
jgi:hypothetical protein